ncbi:MAG: DUF5916 domain-containing protein [Vicinamibacterales bacterium]
MSSIASVRRANIVCSAIVCLSLGVSMRTPALAAPSDDDARGGSGGRATTPSGGVIDAVAVPAGVIDAVAVPAGAGPMRIDGELTETAWGTAPSVTGFLQREPREGAPATHETDVRVLYDRAALYVAVTAMEPDAGAIAAHLTRRDEASPSDWLRVVIDSYHDRRTAYEFGVNAAGVKADTYRFNDTNQDTSWDAVWDVAVARTPGGWRAEFRIPFSQLRFDPSRTETFGFAVVRTVAHVNETSSWPLLPRSASGYVSSLGELRGLTVAPAQKRVELAPYVLTETATQPVAPGDPLTRSPDASLTGGVDVRYQVASGLTLTGTVNPDFGQVEADPAVVNLGAFETFFAERRPFFVEGSGNLSFNLDCSDGQCTGLFYSRRIGRAPQRVADPGEGFAAQPTSTTILGAAKLTGRVGGFTVGAVNAITSREDARLAGPGATTSSTPVEPATSYTAVRVGREFANQSRLGVMVTSTNRRLADELRFLPGSATTGGVDGDLRFGGGRFSLNGYWAGSLVRGDAAAIDRLQRNTVHSFQRPDAGHLDYDPTRTSLGGHAGSISLSKIAGRRTRFQSYVGYKTPGFDVNDLGFLSRADEIATSQWFQVRDDTPGRFVRSLNLNVNHWAGWNWDGDRRYAGGNVNAHWTFTNNWTLGTGVNYNARGFNDRLTRGGPGGFQPANWNGWGYVTTDERRLASGTLNYSWLTDPHGSWTWSLSPSLTLRPGTALVVNTGVSVTRNRRDAQWITNLTEAADTHYLFGRLDQTTVGVNLRVNYTLRPTLTLQVYARPFVSSGAYDQFKELADGRAGAYGDRYRPYAWDGDPDFTYLSFRTTNVLRWEYRPGSALFLVWQQGREDVAARGDFRFGRDVGAAFDAPATNVFLVKISRWFNF